MLMITRLAALGDPGLILVGGRGEDEDGNIGMGRARDRVLDEIGVVWGISDREVSY